MTHHYSGFGERIKKSKRNNCRCSLRLRRCCCVGPTGPQGEQGLEGAEGKSAYQIALDNGFIGTETDWLDSLKGETGPTGPQGPFLSSYIEAVGRTQSVDNGRNIIFDIDEDALDIVGDDIEVDPTGSIFTIKRAGLYHIEWSIDLESGTQPIILGLLEDGAPASALSNIASTGNYSSGALINVEDTDIPYTVSLHNFGGAIEIQDHTGFINTAASIRILRFADGPSL